MVEDGRALLETAERVHPDIVILDVSMPLLNGIDAATQLKKTHPSIKVIFVTMHADADYVRSAFEAGASGYLLKRSAVDELEQAIRAVWAGHTYITPLIAKDLLDVLLTLGAGQAQQRKTSPFVSARCCNCWPRGERPKTSRSGSRFPHEPSSFIRAQLMEQLNLHTTAELIKYALTHGFIASS
jgi:DNA-binding response OmpR family regulator